MSYDYNELPEYGDDIYNGQLWEEMSSAIFNEFGDLLNESAVAFTYYSYMTGPGGDWDGFDFVLEGCDSGMHVSLLNEMHNTGEYCWPLAAALADYVAEAMNGEVEVIQDPERPDYAPGHLNWLGRIIVRLA